ncbi:MAG: dipeptidase PepV [Lachnospiraceae bacterium]|nr:dipeptidase PepV [Lachnospiraceae bacterium]MBQ9606979.1 dipeptidase PepV [Lachnospiraceae bacterium]MBR1523952.1 dipeptidase PepV [Lachnospiraceae bacterium]
MVKLDDKIEAMQDELVSAVQRLVRIKSVEDIGGGGKPYGKGVADCLAEALKMCGEMGFPTVNMDDQCGWCEYGEGDEMIAVLGHLDVVPEGEGWNYPPYEAVVSDGRIYGRGTIDDKGPVAASLIALKAIKDSGIRLNKRVRIIFGCNEETGAADMKYYLANGGEIPVMGFTPDGEYPLINGEKGIINETYEKDISDNGEYAILHIDGGVAGNVTPRYAEALIKAPKDFIPGNLPEKITVSGKDGNWLIAAEGVAVHAQHPEKGENAIGRLFLYLDTLPFEGSTKEAVSFIAGKIGMETHGERLGCDLYDEISGHTSFNMGVCSSDGKAISVKLNYRYPVTHEYEECQPLVEKAFTGNGWEQKAHQHKPKLYISEEEELVKSLMRVYREYTGDTSGPKSIGGGTYAKAIPNILAYGPIFPGDEVVEHMPNEYVSIDRLVENAKIIAAAITELVGV